MKQSNRVFAISAFLLLAISSTVMQSVADTAKSTVVLTEEEQSQHIEKMKGMTAEERARYRNEQYEILRKKAAAIGYEMPDTPPWTEQTQKAQAQQEKDTGSKTTMAPRSARSSTVSTEDSDHLKQLEKYRKAAAEKREAMQDRLEKQRQSVQERIDKLVEKNAVKPTPERSRPRPRTRTYMPAPPPAPPFPGYYPPPWRSGYYY